MKYEFFFKVETSTPHKESSIMKAETIMFAAHYKFKCLTKFLK